MLSIETYNFEAVERALEAVPNEITALMADGLARDGATLVQAEANYPEERPEQEYVRTYEYQRSVNAKIVAQGDSVTYTQMSESPANYYTRGDAESYDGAWMHRGRWQSLRKIVETVVPEVINRLVQRIEYYLRFKFG